MKPLLTLVFLVAASPLFGQGWAEYRGRSYRVNSQGRICSSPGCAMCNSLQASYLSSQSWETAVKEVEQELVPMPTRDVNRLMRVIDPKPNTVLYDLGCGDGRILLAAKEEGCIVGGIEINRDTYEKALLHLQQSGPYNWSLVCGDATKYTLREADVVTVYLFPSVLSKIKWDTMRPGTRIVSYQHEIPGMVPSQTIRLSGCRFYVYTN